MSTDLPGTVYVTKAEMIELLGGALDRANDRIDKARAISRQLVHMEREHTGSGREGHLSEADLRPLLHALGIDTGEQP